MKSKLWTMMKVQLMNTYSLNTLFKEPDKKKRNKRLGYYFAIAIVVIMLIGYSAAMSFGMCFIGMGQLVPSFGIAISSLVSLIFTITKANGTIFAKEDYDMLMSLPVKTTVMITSRFSILYVSNLIFTAIVMIPMVIVYGIMLRPEVSFYLLFFFGLLFGSLLPTVIATLIGYVFVFLSAHFSKLRMVGRVLGMILILIAVTSNFWIRAIPDKAFNTINFKSLGNMIEGKLQSIYPLASMFRRGTVDGSLIDMVLFIVISVLAYVIFVLLLGSQYKKLVTGLRTASNHVTYHMQELKMESPVKALYKKEWKCYTSCSPYMMNTVVGALISIAMGIGFAIAGLDNLMKIMEIPVPGSIVVRYIPYLITMFLGMSTTTGVCLSMEGKNLWIIKSSPVSLKDIIHSKIAVSFTVMIPAAIISGGVLGVATAKTIEEFLTLFLMPIFHSVFITMFGIFINSKFLNYEWENEIEVIKRGASSAFTIFGGMIFSCVQFGIALIFYKFNIIVGAGINLLLLVLLSVIFYTAVRKDKKLLIE